MDQTNKIHEKEIYTLDLNFMGIPGTIASYLIPHTHGVVLIESGPGSTLPSLQNQLNELGFQVSDITDVLLTHIHLDHAGAAGWLARQGARIHVHPVGAPHLLDPTNLLASAGRIYGDMMDQLWGEFLSVPQDQLSILEDNRVLEIDSLQFKAIDTPGHANHHFAYIYEDACFSGDIGGVRIPGPRHLRLPMPPPEFNLEKWRQSVERLRSVRFDRIIPTHFGIYTDPGWHLDAIERALNQVEDWMAEVMPKDLSFDELNQEFLDWTRNRSLEEGLSPSQLEAYETANPSWMSTYGIQRYWRKYKNPQIVKPE
jgi:glyoxylase-like metal-dependent hydrolase (beta-lactamase superfamily II)